MMVGKKIVETRKKKGVSQEDLVEKTGFDLRQIGRIERGESNPTISTIEAIATVLDVELKDLTEVNLSTSEKFDLEKFKNDSANSKE